MNSDAKSTVAEQQHPRAHNWEAHGTIDARFMNIMAEDVFPSNILARGVRFPPWAPPASSPLRHSCCRRFEHSTFRPHSFRRLPRVYLL